MLVKQLYSQSYYYKLQNLNKIAQWDQAIGYFLGEPSSAKIWEPPKKIRGPLFGGPTKKEGAPPFDLGAPGPPKI